MRVEWREGKRGISLKKKKPVDASLSNGGW